jgi:elongation factor G
MVEMTAEGSLVALAFKVQLWEGRRHVFVRVYRGRLAPGDKVAVAGKDTIERIARVFDVDASSKKRLESVQAGQIALLAGLRKATTGDTLCSPESPLLLERIDTKEPVLGLAVEANSTKDEEKLLEVLGKICEEDPTLRFEEDPETGQRILKGMGELHLQIIFERIQREFNLSVRAGKPRVVSRETIAGPGKAETLLDRVLKMGDTEVPLKARATASVRPLERNTGIQQVVEPVLLPAGASLSAAQEEAVRAGVNDAVMAGPIEGAPLQDVAVRLDRLTLFAEGSTPQALRIVASQAVREAISNAGGQLLRPLMDVEVVVPDENLGTVLGDLQSRSAIILGQTSDMGMSTVRGECPLQALLGYATELRSLTRGRGQFTMEFARFDVG